jgi:hypothetical protein
MIQLICLIIIYCIFLVSEHIYNGFIPNQLIQYLHERNIELAQLSDEIPDNYYYLQDETGKIELRAPIFMSLKE